MRIVKVIEKNLKKILIDDGPLSRTLFDSELAVQTDEFARSRREDGDAYFLALTEHAGEVALLLIDEHDNVHVNDTARTLLKQLWRDAYKKNMHALMPQMVEDLDAGRMFVAGVKMRE